MNVYSQSTRFYFLILVLFWPIHTHAVLFETMRQLAVMNAVGIATTLGVVGALVNPDKVVEIAREVLASSADEAQASVNLVTFDDIAGGVPSELRDLVSFLEDPSILSQSGIDMPHGYLLHGPPGTGKTLLAQAVAGEVLKNHAHGISLQGDSSPFIESRGSDFIEEYVGVGPKRVRELFTRAQAAAQRYGFAIIFIDEIDAVGASRRVEGNAEYRNTLTALLAEMDGFKRTQKGRIIVIAATNTKDILDPALIRPGRFDRHIYVGLPNEYQRAEIIKYYALKGSFAPSEAVIQECARATKGWSPAELKATVQEALISAMREKRSPRDSDIRSAVVHIRTQRI